jgi:hypothetical protein
VRPAIVMRSDPARPILIPAFAVGAFRRRHAPLLASAFADPANPAMRAVRERLMKAGFAEVTLLTGVPQVAFD